MLPATIARDPAARSRTEVALAYPGFHAVLLHRMAHSLWRREFRLLSRFLSNIGRWVSGADIHPGAVIGRRFFMDHAVGIVIGIVVIQHSVAVGVGTRDAHAVEADGETSLAGDVREPARAVVGVERLRRLLARPRAIRPEAAVDQDQVRVAVQVVVDEGRAAAHGLGQELPAVGAKLSQGKAFGTIEAVKAVSDLYAPVSGEVAEVNKLVQEKPEVVNKDPYGGGWTVAVTLQDPGELAGLMTAAQYEAHVAEIAK